MMLLLLDGDVVDNVVGHYDNFHYVCNVYYNLDNSKIYREKDFLGLVTNMSMSTNN